MKEIQREPAAAPRPKRGRPRGRVRVIMIRRSCISGRVVWVGCGPTKDACYKQYLRAGQAELALHGRISGEISATLRANIRRIRNECVAEMNPMLPLTEQQKEALQLLKILEEEGIAPDSEFIRHFQHERVTRRQDRAIRAEMRRRAEQEKREKQQQKNQYNPQSNSGYV